MYHRRDWVQLYCSCIMWRHHQERQIIILILLLLKKSRVERLKCHVEI